MKICATYPDGDRDSDGEAKYCPGCPKDAGFGGEESGNGAFGCTQRLHDGKVSAAVEDPSD